MEKTSRSVRVTKDILKSDYPWLPRDLKDGEELRIYEGFTYGCVSKEGLAVDIDGIFYEVPRKDTTENGSC